jgi:hypothetical protein
VVLRRCCGHEWNVSELLPTHQRGKP